MGKLSFVFLLASIIPAFFVVLSFSAPTSAAGPVSLETPGWLHNHCKTDGVLGWAEIAASDDTFNYSLYDCTNRIEEMKEFNGKGWTQAHCIVKYGKAFWGLAEYAHEAWCYSSEKEARNNSTEARESDGVAGTTADSNTSSNSNSAVPSDECPETSFFGKTYCDGDKIAADAIPRMIIDILNWALVGVGTVVVIFVVIGGIMYMTAAGSQEQAKNGTKVIRNAVLGLVLYILMLSILNFIVPGGVFSS